MPYARLLLHAQKAYKCISNLPPSLAMPHALLAMPYALYAIVAAVTWPHKREPCPSPRTKAMPYALLAKPYALCL